MSRKLAKSSGVLTVPNKLLKTKCEPVDIQDKVGFRSLCKVLRESWEAAGMHKGLAANQVGILQRLILCRFDRKWLPGLTTVEIMVNPEIVWKWGSKNSNEGCESVGPDRYIVKRPLVGKVRYVDEFGEVKSKVFFYSKLRIICHEVDHLDGLLLTDVGHKWAGNNLYKKMSKKGK